MSSNPNTSPTSHPKQSFGTGPCMRINDYRLKVHQTEKGLRRIHETISYATNSSRIMLNRAFIDRPIDRYNRGGRLYITDVSSSGNKIVSFRILKYYILNSATLKAKGMQPSTFTLSESNHCQWLHRNEAGQASSAIGCGCYT